MSTVYDWSQFTNDELLDALDEIRQEIAHRFEDFDDKLVGVEFERDDALLDLEAERQEIGARTGGYWG